MTKKNIKLSKKNINKINDFEKHLKSKGIRKEATLRSYTSSAKSVLFLIDKDYNKLTKQDITDAFSTDEYAESSLEIMKAKFRHFLIFINKKKLAKTIVFNHKALDIQKYSEDDILKPDEIKALVNAPTELYDKAFLELLIASGGRKSEIRLLKYKNIKIDEGVIWLHVDGKTGKRNISLVYNEKYEIALPLDNFMQFYRSHPHKNNEDKWFFYSTSYNKKYRNNPMSRMTPNDKLERYRKEAGIKKHITPHLLRHTSATYDALHFSEDSMKIKYGWKHGSKMLERYCHSNSKLMAEHLLKEAGLTSEYIKENSICPNCKQSIHYNEKVCPNCHHILDRKILNEKIEKQRKQIEEYQKMQDAFPILERKMKKFEKGNKQYSRVIKNQNKKMEKHDQRFDKLKGDYNNIIKMIKPIFESDITIEMTNEQIQKDKQGYNKITTLINEINATRTEKGNRNKVKINIINKQ